MESKIDLIQQFFIQLVAHVANFIPKLAAGLLIFAAFWIGAAIVRALVNKTASHSRIDKQIVGLLSRIAGATIIILGAVTALGTMGVNVTGLIAGVGLTGFAFGLAFKDALQNALSGILVLIYRPFRVGDKISVSGLEGIVNDIDLRYTVLATDEKTILIPNSNMFVNNVIIFKPAPPPQVQKTS